MIHGGERDERAEVAVDSTVVLLPSDDLRQMLEESTSLSLGMAKLAGHERMRQRRKSLVEAASAVGDFALATGAGRSRDSGRAAGTSAASNAIGVNLTSRRRSDLHNYHRFAME